MSPKYSFDTRYYLAVQSSPCLAEMIEFCKKEYKRRLHEKLAAFYTLSQVKVESKRVSYHRYSLKGLEGLAFKIANF